MVFKIETLPHKTFKRDGDNLKMEVVITLKESLLGFDKVITHLDGHKVKLSKRKITKPGEKETIKGEGMPNYDYPSDYGDLIITYKVVFPEKLDED